MFTSFCQAVTTLTNGKGEQSTFNSVAGITCNDGGMNANKLTVGRVQKNLPAYTTSQGFAYSPLKFQANIARISDFDKLAEKVEVLVGHFDKLEMEEYEIVYDNDRKLSWIVQDDYLRLIMHDKAENAKVVETKISILRSDLLEALSNLKQITSLDELKASMDEFAPKGQKSNQRTLKESNLPTF